MSPNIEYILSQTPSAYGFDFDPRALIRSVNALHPLGKETALRVIDAFARNNSLSGDILTGTGMFLVMRCLFEVPNPPGFMPSVGFNWNPPEPANARLLPQLPLVIVGDIPLMLVRLGGPIQSGPILAPSSHVEYFRREGRLRAKPLIPTNHPEEIMAQFESLPLRLRWDDARQDYVRGTIDPCGCITGPQQNGK